MKELARIVLVDSEDSHLFSFKCFVERCLANFNPSGSFPDVQAGCQMLASLGEFIGCYDRLATAAPATFLRGLQPGASPFPDQVALELRQCPDQSLRPRRSGGVPDALQGRFSVGEVSGYAFEDPVSLDVMDHLDALRDAGVSALKIGEALTRLAAIYPSTPFSNGFYHQEKGAAWVARARNGTLGA